MDGERGRGVAIDLVKALNGVTPPPHKKITITYYINKETGMTKVFIPNSLILTTSLLPPGGLLCHVPQI